MKCPRCGGNMSSGVCNSCGFPVTRLILYNRSKPRSSESSLLLKKMKEEA